MEVNPLPLGNGRLCIGHRPGKALLPALREAGVTHVVTLLGPDEGAEALIDRVEEAGFASRWLPLAGARPVDEPDRIVEIAGFYDDLASLLERGNTLYLHCSAGIHRTGMIGYGLLRHVGIPTEAAKDLLGRLRPVTLAGVTDARLDWGEQFASQR